MIGGSFPEAGAPSAPPEGPLDMLSRLHARTLHHCAMLRRLVLYLTECGCDEQARRVAATVLRYFDTGPPQYFSDEEEDLFPALLESMAGSDAVCLNDLTEGMARQHRTLETMWARLRKAVAAVASGQGSILDIGAVEAFVTLYQSHFEHEQAELLPMAARLLTDEALAQVWSSMRRRHQS